MPTLPMQPDQPTRNGHVDIDSDHVQTTDPNLPTSTAPAPSELQPMSGMDDRSVFNQLIEIAREAGRFDLVEEFRRRCNEPAPAKPAEQVSAKAHPGVSRLNNSIQVAEAQAKEGLTLLRANRLTEAMEKLRVAIAIDPQNHDAHANLGVALGRLGRRPEAERSFREAIRIRPDYAPMYGNLGLVCQEQNKLPEAEDAFRQAIHLAPKQADFHRHLGYALEARGQLAEAETAYRSAIELKPKELEYHIRLGTLLSRSGRFPEAEAEYRQITNLQPDKAQHWIWLGQSLEAQNQSAAAEPAFRVAVALAPNHAEAHNSLGVALASQNRNTEAEASYRKALELNPKLAMVHNNLGNCLRQQDRFEPAIECLREAVRLEPKYAEAHNNLGIAYIQQRNISEGLACYDEAIRLKPDYPEAHLNRSLIRLGAGDFEGGWPEYEWRFRMRNRKPPSGPGRLWDGAPLDGQTLLLLAEQGLGDIVQFMRYAALIPRGSGGTVILECPEGLMELARTCPGIDQVVPRGKPLPNTDLFISLLSIPGIFKTNYDSIPAAIPYFSTDPSRVAYWEEELETLPGCRVGISWQGSLDHRGDRIRSIPLSRFQVLQKLRGVTLCSIQKGYGIEQMFDGSAGDIFLYDLGARTKPSFSDTAALMQVLDLIVTVDTAVAHVAGALGVPVWVLLPCSSDWRWLQDREDTPWYPTMRLFRQPKPGDWDSVFTQLVAALEQFPDRDRLIPKGIVPSLPQLA